MLTIDKRDGNRVAVVKGSPSDRMLFFCFWQTSLWPEWMRHEKLGQATDIATKEFKRVVDTLNADDVLLLSNGPVAFFAAVNSAVEKCRLLGIKVVVEIEGVVESQ